MPPQSLAPALSLLVRFCFSLVFFVVFFHACNGKRNGEKKGFEFAYWKRVKHSNRLSDLNILDADVLSKFQLDLTGTLFESGEFDRNVTLTWYNIKRADV